MAVAGWILDKSAAARAADPAIAGELPELAGSLCVCPVASSSSCTPPRLRWDYDELKSQPHDTFRAVASPVDILDRALTLQQDLARHPASGIPRRSPTC